MAALDWMEKARNRVNKDPAYKQLGTADLDVAFKAGKTVRRVTFEAFEVARVEDGDETTLRDVEVVVEMPTRDWTNYLKRRKKGAGPSLNALDLDRGIVSARSPLERLKFDRFNRSVQAFVDQGARYVAS